MGSCLVVLMRSPAPCPEASASSTSGRVAWFSIRGTSAVGTSESPRTTPSVRMSVTRASAAAPSASASASQGPMSPSTESPELDASRATSRARATRLARAEAVSQLAIAGGRQASAAATDAAINATDTRKSFARTPSLTSSTLDEARRYDPLGALEQLAREPQEDRAKDLFGVGPAVGGELRDQLAERRLAANRVDHERLGLGKAEHLEPDGRRSDGLEHFFVALGEHRLQLFIAVAVTDTTAYELAGIDPEGERLFLRAYAAGEGDLALLHAERLEEALLRLLVNGAKELDGPQDADPHEGVAETAAEARQHGEGHLELHAKHLPSLDQELAEELALLGRRHALGRPLDEEDSLLSGAVAQDERARLAPNGDVEDAGGQPRRIEHAPIDRIGGQIGVPAKRGAAHEARELGIRAGGLEAALFAGDDAAAAGLARCEHLDEARERQRTDDAPVFALQPVNAGGHRARRGRREA